MANFDRFTITQINDHDKEMLHAYKLVHVPGASFLRDTRSASDFKTHTLGGYPRAQVFTSMEKAMATCKIEHACYWAFQLLASGQAAAVWDRLMAYCYKQINIANPGLGNWLLNKDRQWVRLLPGLELRNNQLARNLIGEVVVQACLSRKRKLDTLTLKIKETDFIITNFHAKCLVRNNDMISSLLGPNDPSEIRISANEFCYHLVNKRIQDALYWLNWILYWEKINIKKYKSFIVQARAVEGVPAKDQRDVIWLLWSVIQLVKGNGLDARAVSCVEQLWQLYIHKWKPAAKQKKLPLLVWAMHVLVYPMDWALPVVERPEIFIKAGATFNLLFEKMMGQCQQRGAVTGPSLLDARSAVPPGVQKTGGSSSAADIRSLSGGGLDVIIEDHFKPAEEAEPTRQATGGKQGKGGAQHKELSTSLGKISIVNQLDAYLQ